MFLKKIKVLETHFKWGLNMLHASMWNLDVENLYVWKSMYMLEIERKCVSLCNNSSIGVIACVWIVTL